jgi:23S rRNA (uracil1939-C5)-methyltransferase
MTKLTITGLSHDLRGVARQNGLVWFVKGALPDEQVIVRETGRRTTSVDADVIAVERPSALRVEPACEYYGACGGCSLQHLSHEGQLQLKQEMVLDQLQRAASIVPATVLPPLVSEPWQYRRRARLSTRWIPEIKKLAVGFRQNKESRIVNIDHCAVLEPALQAILLPLRTCLSTFSDPRKLGHVDIVYHNQQLAIGIRVLEKLCEVDALALQEFARQHIANVYVQEGKEDSVTSSLIEDDHELLADFYPGDFLQGNAAVNSLLVQAVLEAIEPQQDDVLLDAFCGRGNFTYPLAACVQHITALEVDQGMVERAAIEAREIGIGNVSFQRVNLDAAFTLPSGVHYNKVLLDPPRTGARHFCEKINLSQVTKLVYVSCNPSTLARDANTLRERGWRLSSIQLVDMFPQTFHVETLAVFVPQTKKEVKASAEKTSSGKTVPKGSRIKPFSLR